MRLTIGGSVIELIQGDITYQTTDAIVNAANHHLAGGGGVDGAIHRAAGPSVMAETREKYPHGCPTGSAVLSGGGDLSAQWIIHTIGPIWRGGNRGEPLLLRSAYQSSLEVACDIGCRSVAFPSISTGVYGYPLDDAAEIALTAVADFFSENSQPELVRFVLFHEAAYNAFVEALKTVPLVQHSS
jgi:O-acetyl-ADP-ribose deacetylase